MARPSSRAPVDRADPAEDAHPTSERRRRVEDLIAKHAQAHSVEDLPAELRDNPLIAAAVSMTFAEEAYDIIVSGARREAQALYGDDPAQILAAVEAGTHPLQQLERARR